MKTIYISGAITGVDNYKELFEQKRQELKEIYPSDYTIVCPHDVVKPFTNWSTAMAYCLNLLEKCQYIYFLDNWKQSKGARYEKRYAKKLGITILGGA